MKAEHLENYKEQLQTMRDRLRGDVEKRATAVAEQLKATGEVSDVPTHAADHDAEGIDVEIAAGKTQEQLNEEVRLALERIEEGTYGECLDCGSQIAPERLEAIPYTAYCIECEKRREELGEYEGL